MPTARGRRWAPHRNWAGWRFRSAGEQSRRIKPPLTADCQVTAPGRAVRCTALLPYMLRHAPKNRHLGVLRCFDILRHATSLQHVMLSNG